MQADMFNANLGLQNNAQNMQNNQLNLGNRQQGLNQLGQVMGMQDATFDTFMNASQLPSQMNFNNLNNLSGLLFPSAQLGGSFSETGNVNQSGSQTSKQSGKGTNTQTGSPGIVPSILGTAAGIGAAGRQFGLFGSGGGR
jgi:hypothetical protein